MSKKRNRKSSIKKAVIVVVVVGALWYLYNQTTQIDIGGASVRVHKVNLNGVTLRILLSVLNRSRLDIDVQGFLGHIMYKGVSLGDVIQVQPVTLKEFATGQIEFQAEISWVSLGTEFYQEVKDLLTKGPNTPIDWSAFTVQGTLRAENLAIPINEKLIG